MSEIVKFTIDGKEYEGVKGQLLVEVAAEKGIYIPVLCHWKGVKPAGSCRICSVKVNGRFMAGCTTPLEADMKIENDTPEILDIRKAIVEMLFVEGNHFCPSCEKSGNCDLQALGYRYQMMVPRFPYEFERRDIDASSPKLIIEKNRCIFCKRCVRMIKDEQGKSYFAFKGRGKHLQISLDKKLAVTMSEENAHKAMDACPVGCILRKEVGFAVPIGKRKYDHVSIGTDIEKLNK
ncbi:MAG: NADP oxidoreductase [Bacteroidetes bacterium HGW-Bacteroidetes-21]|jgi:[NiFe] hydrogenase diaphorase moiety small subunit|nr:MAG: NADP oxidoreductase [Bacteroidetes bacterium HGW-Bacteroidetes-21]